MRIWIASLLFAAACGGKVFVDPTAGSSGSVSSGASGGSAGGSCDDLVPDLEVESASAA